jgi:phage-related holin
MILIVSLVIIDLITGIWASRKRGEVISSRRLRKSMPKIIGYLMAILVAIILQSPHLMGDLIPLVRCVATFLAFTETLSIFENISDITGIPLLKYFKKIMRKKDVLNSLLDETDKDDTDTSEKGKNVSDQP